MKLHEIMPQAMLFVRGQNHGISHNPLETTTSDDIQLAVQAYGSAGRAGPRIGELNKKIPGARWRPPPTGLGTLRPGDHPRRLAASA